MSSNSKKPISLTIEIDGMSCDGCVRALTKRLTTTPGVEKVEVSLTPRGRASIEGTIDESTVRAVIEGAGYTPL